ncbi:MAG: hydrogenase small subunit [Candidatus Acetothermia bacterium]
MSPTSKSYSAVWLQGAACTGCAISLMNSPHPRLSNLLVDDLVPGQSIRLKFMATLMGGTGEMALEVLDRLAEVEAGYLLIVDGAVPVSEEGRFCTVGEEAFSDQVARVAKDALAVINIGTCSSYGGIPAGEPNVTGCVSVSEHLRGLGLEKPIINVPGCPPEPSWVVDTIARVMLSGLPSPDDLDKIGRLKEVYGELVHDNCPRRADFATGHFARNIGDEGCLVEVGCKGPYTNSPCPKRQWHDGLNWPVGNNHPCIGCTEPGFPDLMSPFYEKFDMEEAQGMYRRLK